MAILSASWWPSLAELSVHLQLELGTQAKRVEWLGRENKRELGRFHFTPFHGSWLNWIEFWFAIMGRKVLGESFDTPDALKAALDGIRDEWNLLLGPPFSMVVRRQRTTRNRPVKRFTKMLRGSAGKMELRTLTKQMTRCCPICSRTTCQVISRESWEQLLAALCTQSEMIDDLIAM